MAKDIVSDWNGTMFDEPSAESLNRKIGHSLLNDAKSAMKRGKLWRAWDVMKLLWVKRSIERRLREYKGGHCLRKK